MPPFKAAQVAAYLTRLGCTDVDPVHVRIGRASYQGARYRQEFTTPEGCRAYLAGERTYTREGIYLVGPLPASYKRRRNTVYRIEGDSREWYVAGYFDQAQPNEYHPFGLMFTLFPWDVPSGDRIDQYARAPYTRVNIGIASLA